MASDGLRSNQQGKWTFHEGELHLEDVRALLAQHLSFARAVSPPETCHALPIDALGDASIRFFSLREEVILLGVGALKRLSDDHGEVKSMRTADAALGRGVGRAMLNHLLSVAREMGFSRISLETGSGLPFEAANRLYSSSGFKPCKAFGNYADTDFNRFFTREL